MKQHKYEFPDVALFDYQYIQRHLSEMAAKGWRLDKINSMGIWRYRRSEPAVLRYEVTYAPSASAYNSRPTDQEEALSDICAEAGWEKVASTAQLHVYCNEEPNAIPVETDELSRISTLRRAMNRHFIPSQLLLVLLFLMQFGGHVNTLLQWPSNTLSSPPSVGILIMLPTMSLCFLIMIIGYFFWVRRAEQAARDGLPVPECLFYRRFRIVLWGMLAVYLVGIVSALNAMAAVATFGMVLLIILFVSFSLECCKALNAPRWVNIAAPFLVSFLALMLVMPMVFVFLDSAPDEPELPETLPLVLADVLDTDAEYITVTYEEASSLLASKLYLWQEDGDSGQEISYTIIDTDLGFAYDMCLREQEQNFMQSASWSSNGVVNVNQSQVWDAEYARQATGDYSERWLICWEGRIVSLRTSWPLTEEQIIRIKDALMP